MDACGDPVALCGSNAEISSALNLAIQGSLSAMVPITAYFGDVTQVALAAIATVLMIVSINAYRKKSEGRYFLLALAFVSLFIVSVSTLAMELFIGIGPTDVQFVELYFIPAVELLMVISFLVALLWTSRAGRRVMVAFFVAITVLGLAVLVVYVSSSGAVSNPGSVLPADCVRPAGGFLIVASSLGYNESMVHGAPTQSWPVMAIPAGSNVTITICNTYQQAIGFQVVHYLQDKVESVAPGHALTVSFLADERGTFTIYCGIFCSIHLYLQGGELKVT
jgi:hypothetical protein